MADKKTASPGSWGRAVDYLLGRNTLIGVASLMLLLISGFATWHGMRDFIIGVSTSPAASSPAAPRRHVVLQRLPCHHRRLRAHLPDVAVPARDVRRAAPLHRPARHLSALRVPRHLVDRLWLRLLVEPHRRRGGDAHGAFGLAAGCGRCRGRGRCAPRCGEGAARFRRHLVGKPDGARGNERRQLRHLIGGRARPALCRARKRARPDRVPAQQRADLVAGPRAGRYRIPAEERRAAPGDDRRRASAELRCHGEQHPHARPRHRRPLQRARQVDGDRDARDRGFGVGGAGTERVHLPRPDTGAAPDAGGRPGRSAGDAEPARGLVQRRPRRRRQRHQATVGEHRHLSVEPVRLHLVGRQDDGRDDAHGPADHRPRYDRVAGHHRHRPGPAGAGDPQSASGPRAGGRHRR